MKSSIYHLSALGNRLVSVFLPSVLEHKNTLKIKIELHFRWQFHNGKISCHLSSHKALFCSVGCSAVSLLFTYDHGQSPFTEILSKPVWKTGVWNGTGCWSISNIRCVWISVKDTKGWVAIWLRGIKYVCYLSYSVILILFSLHWFFKVFWSRCSF
jgi:hypothetical protein